MLWVTQDLRNQKNGKENYYDLLKFFKAVMA